MNTTELVEMLATEQSLTKIATKAIVESVFQAITDAAAQGNEVNFPGFGKFKVQERPARDGRNPSTGETIKIAASKKLTFQPAKAVKDRLNA